MSLLTFTESGIYCPAAQVYIDPWRRVDKALITHGHSDHARRGHQAYLCTHAAKPTMQHRLGAKMKIESIEFGDVMNIHGVKFSFHPAGHIIGSAQIRVEHKGEVWVVSGDYKIQRDGFTEDFELVPCNTFITECTFGRPIYKWRNQDTVFEEINNWWHENSELGKVSVLTGYSLGKAQRLLQNVDGEIGPIFTHPTIEKTNAVIRAQGRFLQDTILVEPNWKKEAFKGGLVIAPPSVIGTPWMNQFKPYATATASGWMNVRKWRRNRAVDRSFVVSDHADWDGLNETIKATGAEKIYVTHGFTKPFCRWLKGEGYDADVVKTEFEGEGG